MNVMARNLLTSLGRGPYLKSAAQAGKYLKLFSHCLFYYLNERNWQRRVELVEHYVISMFSDSVVNFFIWSLHCVMNAFRFLDGHR